MDRPDPTRLAFDDVVIDFAGHRVLRDGIRQPLEPKAFGVLALLAQAPGRVFTRDEILDAVWSHRHVTPGVLNRVMTLLRHALGEDAHTPRYLHTLHGVGYRFDLPTAAVALTAPPEDLVPPAAVVPALDPDPQSGPAPAFAPDLPPRRRTSDSTPPHAAPARRLWAFAALLLLSVGALAYWQWPRPPQHATVVPDTAAPAIATMVVMPLRAIGGEAGGRELAAGLSEALIGTLSHIRGLRVIARDSAALAAEQSTTLPELVARLGVSHVLEGSVRQDGQQLRISARLLEATSGRLLWSKDFDRQAEDLFALQDNIAAAVGGALQLQMQIGATPAAAAHEDPALYRRYLLAAGQINMGVDSPLTVAAELRALVAEHPDYARGWGGLAFFMWGQSALPRPGRDALRAEAEHAAEKALALDPHQPDALAVLGGQACREQRWEECLRLAQGAVHQSPSAIQWRVLLAQHLATMGYVSAALRELDAVQTLDPLASMPNQYRGRVLDTLGRHDEARRASLLANPSRTATSLYFNAAWRGDAAEMRRIATALPMETPWRKSVLTAADAMTDPSLWPAVEALVPAEERQLASQGGVAYGFSRLLLPNRDFARDIDGLDQVQRQGYASYQWIFWQPESRGLRQSPAFQQYLKRSGLLAHWRKHGFPPQCRAHGDGAACDDP